VCFRDDPALGALSPTALEPRFRVSRGYRGLDPRPCPSPRLALFTRCADGRFSGSGYRPTTSATDYPTHGHTPEPPAFALRAVPRFTLDVEGDLALACFLGHATFPSRRRITRAANRDSPSGADRAMLQASPLGETPKAVPRSTRRLRATPRSDHRLRRWPLENSAGLHGPSSSEQGTVPFAACCRRTTRVMVPLLWRAPQSTPGCRRFFARWAGCSRRAHEPTKAPVPASPREGQRIPESRDAFRHQESR